jgi:cytochrome subunit of sulfide dehydrogenase
MNRRFKARLTAGLGSTLFGAMALALAVTQAHAQTAAALQLRSLAATCASCHGTGGRAVDAAAVPGLAGLPAAYLAEQMKAFKGGARAATVMHQISKGYSDAQIDQLAAYFAAQAK